MRFSAHLSRIAILSLGVALVACGGDSGGDGGGTTPGPTLSQILLSPTLDTLRAIGDTRQFQAIPLDQNGNQLSGISVTWSSANSSIVTVSSGGLATAASPGTTAVRAQAQGVTGSANVFVILQAADVEKVSGDDQTGEAGEALSDPVVVRVVDAAGTPIPNRQVAFTVTQGGGSPGAPLAITGTDGVVSMTWTLGSEGAQQLEASVDDVTAVFTATAQIGALKVETASVERGRETLDFAQTFESSGGEGTARSWSVASGTLPSGLFLGTDGDLAGTPTASGVFNFGVRVTDEAEASATASYTMTVCDAPLELDTGDLLEFAPNELGTCGVYLPAGTSGDYYRFAALWPDESSSSSFPVSIAVVGDDVQPGLPDHMETLSTRQRTFGGFPMDRGLREALEIAEATRAHHIQMRESEARLLQSLGPNIRPLPDLSDDRAMRAMLAPAAVAPDRWTYDSSTSGCTTPGSIRVATLLGQNDHMAIYQDSIQRATNAAPVSGAQQMLDYYRDHGKEVIDEYFGGVSDINGDGQVRVIISPSVTGNVAAFVWSGDLLPQGSGPDECAQSNGMELVFFNVELVQNLSGDSPSWQALGTLVHEVKHVSSLYKGIVRFGTFNPYFHPSWIEEGTAEIAAEMSSRVAWSRAGGPAVGNRLTREDFQGFGFAGDNYGVVLRLARTVGYLSNQPNSVVTKPVGSDNSVYGSGWNFHRFVGDLYGDAGDTPRGDAAFFTAQNDSTIVAGTTAFPALVGKSYAELYREFAEVVMREGTPAEVPGQSYQTYNMWSAVEVFCSPNPVGEYPWPVTANGIAGGCGDTDPDENAVNYRSFETRTVESQIGASGIVVWDFVSNGSGNGAEFHLQNVQALPLKLLVLKAGQLLP